MTRKGLVILGGIVSVLLVANILLSKKTFGARTSDNSNLTTTTFSGSLLFTPNNTNDIGAFGSAAKNSHVSSTAFANATVLGNGTVGSPSLRFVDTDTGLFASSSESGIHFTIDGQNAFTIDDGGIMPGVHAALDLGTFFEQVGGHGAFNNIMASGTLRASSSLFMDGSAGAPAIGSAISPTNGIYFGSTGVFVTVGGNTILGIASGLVAPFGNNTVDLGTYADSMGFGAYESIYASSTVYSSTSLYSGLGGAGAPTIAHTLYPTTGFNWGDAGISVINNNRIILTFGSDAIFPFGGSQIDIGGFNSGGFMPFFDIYSSGTIRMATSSVIQTTGTSTLFVRSRAALRGGQVIYEDTWNGNCYTTYFSGGISAEEAIACPPDDLN